MGAVGNGGNTAASYFRKAYPEFRQRATPRRLFI